MHGKRELLARVCSRTGLTRILETLPQRRALIILNYHRIGNADETPFDSGVFSATAEQFDSQIAYLKRRFQMATLEDVFAMINGNAPRGTSVLITFDDGYLDNYTLAFPILRSHAVQAVFFLPTAFIGTGKLPWWDTIAYIIKRSIKKRIHLEYPEPANFDVAVDGGKRVSMEILRPEQQVMQAALQVRSARAEILAGNIANADTPGYVARDLKFDAALDQMLDAGSQDTPSSDSIATPENLRFDHNDVDVNQELSKSYDNSLSYVATLKLYGDSMNRIVTATNSN